MKDAPRGFVVIRITSVEEHKEIQNDPWWGIPTGTGIYQVKWSVYILRYGSIYPKMDQFIQNR